MAYNISFSAVRKSRAKRQSGFFKPEVKGLTAKKYQLINQKNTLANNLSAFNRGPPEMMHAQEMKRCDVAKEINDANRKQENLQRV